MIENAESVAPKCEVLAALGPDVTRLIAEHIRKRGALWMPADIVSPKGVDLHDRITELMRAAAEVPPSVRAIFGLNLVTEKGLPYYLQLLAKYLGLDSIFKPWIGQWTMEEDRHGELLCDLARLSGLIPHMGKLQEEQSKYIYAGFRPPWRDDPYCALGYTSVQEELTKIAHYNTSLQLKDAGGTVLSAPVARIVGEEGHHAHFYAEVVGLVFRHDPDRMLCSLLAALRTFYMPGKSMPSFDDLEEVARRIGILGPSHLADVVNRLLIRWGVANLSPRQEEAAKAQETLFKLPPILHKKAEKLQKKSAGLRTFSISFLAEPFTI